jgi:hypothetical protein
MRPLAQQHQAMQRLSQICITQLTECPGNDFLVFGTDSCNTDSQTVLCVYALFLNIILNFQHLLCTLRDSHVPRRLVDFAAPCHVLQTLFLDFDVEKDEGVQADGHVLLDAVVEGRRLPVVEEEDHGDGLAEVVQLQTGRADGGQDAGIGDRAGGDG